MTKTRTRVVAAILAAVIAGLLGYVSRPTPSGGFFLRHRDAESLGHNPPITSMEAERIEVRFIDPVTNGIHAEMSLPDGTEVRIRGVTVNGDRLHPSGMQINVQAPRKHGPTLKVSRDKDGKLVDSEGNRLIYGELGNSRMLPEFKTVKRPELHGKDDAIREAWERGEPGVFRFEYPQEILDWAGPQPWSRGQ